MKTGLSRSFRTEVTEYVIKILQRRFCITQKKTGFTHKEIKESLEYPYKAYKYRADGRLENVSFTVSEIETIFIHLRKPFAHWVGKNCYNAAGEIIMTRQVY